MTGAYRPFVSVVIPCLNEEACIEACLSSVVAQSYPGSRMEILVADGRSSDRTRSIVRDFARRHPEALVRVVDNPDRIQAAGCNRAIAVSRGDVIVRMDAHARYHHDYVLRSIAALAATGAANVGGAARPIHRTFFQRALAAALASPLAVGNAAYRNSDRQGWVDTVWNGAFRRAVFETVGLYDPSAGANEDAELNLRIQKSGGRIFLSRDVIGFYLPRDSMPGLVHQYFRYGMGRARTTMKHRRLTSLRSLAPFVLTSVLALLLFSSFLSKAALMAFLVLAGSYGGAIAVEAARIARRKGAELFPTVLAIFPAVHFAHGAGFAAGLLRYGLVRRWPLDPLLPPLMTPRPDLRELFAARHRSDASAG
jgi:succinoglycan biosynthesis protein ExoA